MELLLNLTNVQQWAKQTRLARAGASTEGLGSPTKGYQDHIRVCRGLVGSLPPPPIAKAPSQYRITCGQETDGVLDSFESLPVAPILSPKSGLGSCAIPYRNLIGIQAKIQTRFKRPDSRTADTRAHREGAKRPHKHS